MAESMDCTTLPTFTLPIRAKPAELSTPKALTLPIRSKPAKSSTVQMFDLPIRPKKIDKPVGHKAAADYIAEGETLIANLRRRLAPKATETAKARAALKGEADFESEEGWEEEGVASTESCVDHPPAAVLIPNRYRKVSKYMPETNAEIAPGDNLRTAFPPNANADVPSALESVQQQNELELYEEPDVLEDEHDQFEDEFNHDGEEIDHVEELKPVDQDVHPAEMVDHVEEEVVGVQKEANEVEEAAQAEGRANNAQEDSEDDASSTTPEQAPAALTTPDSLTGLPSDSGDRLPAIVSPLSCKKVRGSGPHAVCSTRLL
jgi:hypothetical protein